MNPLERLFDLSLDMLCIGGFDGYFKQVNPACTRILGYEEAELLARPYTDFLHPDDRQSTEEALAQLVRGVPVIDFENRYRCKNGAIRWLAWRACSVPDEGTVYAVARDVTEHRRLRQLHAAAEVLRAVEQGTAAATGTDYFRSLVRHLATALGVRYCMVTECLDDPPTRVRTMAFWNGETLVDGFEYDLEGTPCQLALGGAEPCCFGSRVRSLFPADPELARLGAESFVAVRMYDSTRRVIGHLAAMDVESLPEDGVDTSLLRIFADRAGAELGRRRAELERRRLYEQMLHLQKLRSLGVLAGGIAHDFNNILVGILGNSGLALGELPPGSPARRFIERVEQAAERAAELAGQMLAYSGKGQFMVDTFDLRRLVEETAGLLETSISKKAELRFVFAGDVPPVRGDATQIRQVVMNLVTNASDALGDAAGTISVEIGVVEADGVDLAPTWTADELPAGRYVYLAVADTGCGMDADTRAKVFDPFFTTKSTGRGLGMAAVLGIVRGHRGAIKVASDPGHGSTFTVLLPVSDEPAQDRPAAARAAVQPGRGKILVVDDEDLVRDVAEATLTRSGFEVLIAGDGLRALAIVRRQGHELAAVVLDLTMPHMNGEETFHELRRLFPDLPVILTSGYNEPDATGRFAAPGPAGFLKKPYRPDDLLRVVTEVLESATE
jgi:PAS domain S-box-containing protein